MKRNYSGLFNLLIASQESRKKRLSRWRKMKWKNKFNETNGVSQNSRSQPTPRAILLSNFRSICTRASVV